MISLKVTVLGVVVCTAITVWSQGQVRGVSGTSNPIIDNSNADFAKCCQPKIGPVISFVNFNVNPTFSVEGIAISPHNEIYIGAPYEGKIWKVRPDGSSKLFATLIQNPDDGYLLGLVVASDGTLYAAVVGCNVLGMNGVWHIDSEGEATLAMPIPDSGCWASIPNNLAFDDKRNLYATDSADGSVWRLGPHGHINEWVQDPLLMPTSAFGANGVAYRNHSLWIVNSDTGSIIRVPINKDGSAGTPTTFVQSPLLGYPDDDNFDSCGNLWVGDIGNGNLVRIGPEGVPEVMITATQFNGFYWPTNPVFGFGRLRTTVFITGANPSVVKVDLGLAGMVPPQFE
jgi:sugar lactone lactonase YvrE